MLFCELKGRGGKAENSLSSCTWKIPFSRLLSLLLKKVSNELIDLKASHAALLAANNEITNELTALRNDVTSHLQTQSQRLPETNDLKDSHAALLMT